MDKLKLQPLHLTERPSSGHQGGFGTCAFLPDEGQRALAFGWATTHGKTLDPNRYWLCEHGPDGATLHWLPDELSQHYAGQVKWTASTADSNKFMLAFRCGPFVALLLGLHELQLLNPDTGERHSIAIGGTAPSADQVPLRIGHGHALRFPVILAGAADHYHEGRRLALLRVDLDDRSAHWEPRAGETLSDTDYAPMMAGSFHAMVSQRQTWTPLIYSAAYRGSDWLFYVGPNQTSHHRFGMAPSTLGLHGIDLRLQRVVHQASEDSFGDLSRCGEWLILSPHRKNGPRKGRQTLINLNDGRVLEPTPPRGYSGWKVIDHYAGYWWLLPMSLRYGTERVLACAA
ncbi:MAG: hypothetical protein KDI51_09505 [Xanthomonadales bacterium]|nr:hypothetical protein [Xanthomonadales bacterium]